jgi:hypothetical protein
MGAEVLSEAERFFYDHAGFSYGPREVLEDRRVAGARMLAAAEARMLAGPFYVSTEPDDQPWDGDVPLGDEFQLVVVTLWSVEGWAAPVLLGCLGSVAIRSESDPYLRVVAAELALEHLPK